MKIRRLKKLKGRGQDEGRGHSKKRNMAPRCHHAFFFFIPIFNGAPLSVSFGLDLVHQWIFLIISLNYTLEV